MTLAQRHLIIPGKPQLWSRPRVNSRGQQIIMFDPKAFPRKSMGLSFKHLFPEPLDGPIKLEVIYFFGTTDKKKWGKFKLTRGDLDNHIKQTSDCLNQVAYNDDSQICSIIAHKKWAESDSTHIWISILDD